MSHTTAISLARPDRPVWLDADLFPFQSRFVDIDGHQIHYVDEGTGPILLLVHAAPAWSFMYREIIAALRGEFRCIALDYPGFGLSRAAPGFGFGLRDHARAIEGFIDALGLNGITLVANDTGGPIAMSVAARRPELFRAFVLISTFAWSLASGFGRIRFALRVVSSLPFRLLNAVFNLLPRLVSRAAPRRRKLTQAERRALVSAFPSWAHRDRILTLLGDLANEHGYLAETEQRIQAHLADRPALLLYGEHDPARKAGFQARAETLFCNHRSLVVRGEHHFPPLAAGPELAAEIRAWWNRTEVHGAGD